MRSRNRDRRDRTAAQPIGPGDVMNTPMITAYPSGVRLVPAYLDRAAQETLLAALRGIFASAPLYTPRLPKTGKPMSVRMTNCGPLGWVTDAAGYRYQARH